MHHWEDFGKSLSLEQAYKQHKSSSQQTNCFHYCKESIWTSSYLQSSSSSSSHWGERAYRHRTVERVATHNWQSQKKESENRVRERVRGKTLCFACFLYCFFIVQLVCISIAYLVLSVPSGSFDWSLLFRFRISYEYHLIDCCVVVVDSIPRRLFQSSCCVWILNIVVGLSFLYWYRDTFFVGEKYIHIYIHYSKRIFWLVINTHKRTKGITKSLV